MFMTQWFGVTATDAERSRAQEEADIDQIIDRVLKLQSNAAAQQHRPKLRGTHAKGVTVRAQFEVFDVGVGREPALAARLAHGLFATPGTYPAIVRFANSDPKVNSDWKADVRALSFSVDLSGDAAAIVQIKTGRQDFSLQNATTLPINDASAFLATMKVLTASNPAAGLMSLPFREKLKVLRTLTLAQVQAHQSVKPYQQLRYWSTVPFHHGPFDIAKHCLTPSSGNTASTLQKSNPNALYDELVRHVENDSAMSSFDFGLQVLDAGTMTYWGKRHDPSFWVENASVEWKESEAPFHSIGKLTLLSKSHFRPEAGEATYIDVTGNAAPDSKPVGSINRARWRGEVASRKARAS